MNITQLRYIVEVARTKSFTKAAMTLYVTQPTLSIQIKELEKELDHEIFKRSKKEVEITKFGASFLEYAQETIKRYEEFMADDEGENMRLDLGLYWMFGYSGLGELLNHFKIDHPKIKVRYAVDGARDLIERAMTKKIDAAIITGCYADDNDREYKEMKKIFDMTLLDISPLVLLANKKSDLANRDMIALDDLDDRPLLHIAKRSNMFTTVDNYFKSHDIHPQIIGHSSQADICFQMAFYDISYAFCTKETYDSFATHEAIRAIPIVPSIERQLFFIHRKEDADKAIQIFKEYLIQNFHA